MSAVESGYHYRNPVLGEAFKEAHFLHMFAGPVSGVVSPELAIKDFMLKVNNCIAPKHPESVTISPQEFFNTAVDFLVKERGQIDEWKRRDPKRSVTKHLLKFYFGLDELRFNYSQMPTGQALLESTIISDASGVVLGTVHPTLPSFDLILSKKVDCSDAFKPFNTEASENILNLICWDRGQDYLKVLDECPLANLAEKLHVGLLRAC